MKKLVAFILVILFISTSAYAQCPDKNVFIRFIVKDLITGTYRFGAVEILKNSFPGTKDLCPDRDIVIKMIQTSNNTGEQMLVPLVVNKNGLNEPENILTPEEEVLYKEKGIIGPPKINNKVPPSPNFQKKGSTTADAKAKALHSSMD